MNRTKQVLRSRTFLGTLISLVLMAIIAFVYFYPDAAQGNVLQQYDTQQGIAIGQEVKAFHEATGETSRWTNSVFSGMPTFQISPSYPSGALFRWINTVMGFGLPAPANLVMMMMLGFFILLMTMRMRWYVALIGAIAYGFSSYFVILIGAGHIWKFVTLAYIPPTIAGIILCYRGRYLAGAAIAALFAMMQIASNHVQMSYYFLFVILAFVIVALIKAVRAREMRRWLIATGSLAVAGVAAVTANLPSLYYTYEYSKETMRGGHSELTRTDASAGSEAGLDRDYITQYSYGGAETFTLLIPDIKGGATVKPEKGSNKMLTLADLDEAKEMVKTGAISADEAYYLGYVGQYFGEPEPTNGPVYIGALIFALFLAGCFMVRGPLKWALVILTVLSILLALGRNCMWLTDIMIDYMPMYNKFRTVESILVIAEFTMPLLAAMALQQIFTGSPAESLARNRRGIAWGFGIALGICLLAIIAPSVFGSAVTDTDRQTDAMIARQLTAQGADAATLQAFSLNNPRIFGAIENLRYSMVSADAMRSFMIAGAGFGILLLYLYGKLSLGLAAVIAGALVCGDLFFVNKRYLDTESFVPKRLSRGDPFPLTDADRTILADTVTSYRVLNMPQFWQPGPSYRHKTIGGYHAAKLTRYQDLIDRHFQPFLSGNPSAGDWNAVNMLNARYIVDYTGTPLQNEEALGNAWFVDSVAYVDGADAEMAALDVINPARTAVADRRFSDVLGTSAPRAASDTIRLTTYAPNRLTYHAESARGGVAVFSEVFFPWGWTATVDGQPVDIGRVNYLLRAIRLPAGSHTVEMRFDPASLHATDTAATIAVIIIYIALAAALALYIIGRRKAETVPAHEPTVG